MIPDFLKLVKSTTFYSANVKTILIINKKPFISIRKQRKNSIVYSPEAHGI